MHSEGIVVGLTLKSKGRGRGNILGRQEVVGQNMVVGTGLVLGIHPLRVSVPIGSSSQKYEHHKNVPKPLLGATNGAEKAPVWDWKSALISTFQFLGREPVDDRKDNPKSDD